MKSNLIFKFNACLLIVAVVTDETLAVDQHRMRRLSHIAPSKYAGPGPIHNAVSQVRSFFRTEKNTQLPQVEKAYGSPVFHHAVSNTKLRGYPPLKVSPEILYRPGPNVPYKNGPVNTAGTKGQRFHNVPFKTIPLPIRHGNTAYKVHRYNGVQIKSPISLYPIPTTTTTTEAPAKEDHNNNQSNGILSYLSSIQRLIGTQSTLETLKTIGKIASNKDGLRFIANFIKSGVISNPQTSVQLESFENDQLNIPATSYEPPSNVYGYPIPKVPAATYGVPTSANGPTQSPAKIYGQPMKTSTPEISGSLISSRPAQDYAPTAEIPVVSQSLENQGDLQSFELPKVSISNIFSAQEDIKIAPTYVLPPTKEKYYAGYQGISSRPAESFISPNDINDPASQTNSHPEQIYGLPSQTYSPPATTYGQPAQTYSTPVPTSSSLPAQTYGPPDQISSSPALTFETPVNTYISPSQTYGPPVQSYGPQTQQYGKPLQEFNPKAEHASAQEINTPALTNDVAKPNLQDDLKNATVFNQPQESLMPKPVVIYEVPSTSYFSSAPLEKDNISSMPSYDSPITSYGVPISTGQVSEIASFVKSKAETISDLNSESSALPEVSRLPNLLELPNNSNPKNLFGDSQPILIEKESIIETKPVYDLPSRDSFIFSKQSESQILPETVNQQIIVVEEPTQGAGVIKTTYEAPGYSYTQYTNVDVDNEASSSDINEDVTTLQAVRSDTSEEKNTVLTAVPLIIEREPALSSNTNNIMTINRSRKRWQS